MKDRSILSALHDGEIHSPFLEACRRHVQADPELSKEIQDLEGLSKKLQEAPEPSFDKEQAWKRMQEAIASRPESQIKIKKSIWRRRVILSWPAAAAAAFLIMAGALGTGYGLRAQTPVAAETQAALQLARAVIGESPLEIQVSVPRKFTLPEAPGELLLSSFEGGE